MDFATVIISAVMLNKSPGALLAGIGVFASVLMLIFKDSILGVVAGVQLSENDSLHVGDWISIPGSEANGTVTEVSLTAVKILNWDKTTSTVAPYNLITNGFKNYRSMQESNTRRIQRSYMIDADSVVETTPEMPRGIKQNSSDERMDCPETRAKAQRQGRGREEQRRTRRRNYRHKPRNVPCIRDDVPHLQQIHRQDQRLFRHHTRTAGRRHPASGVAALRTQAHGFLTKESRLVFEHLAVMLYRFHLYTFENPSGHDTIVDGYLSPGKNPANVFGLPYPFFTDSGTPMNPGIPPAGSDSSPDISSSKPG